MGNCRYSICERLSLSSTFLSFRVGSFLTFFRERQFTSRFRQGKRSRMSTYQIDIATMTDLYGLKHPLKWPRTSSGRALP